MKSTRIGVAALAVGGLVLAAILGVTGWWVSAQISRDAKRWAKDLESWTTPTDADGNPSEAAKEFPGQPGVPRPAGDAPDPAEGFADLKPEATAVDDDPLLRTVAEAEGVRLAFRVSRVAAMAYFLDRASEPKQPNFYRVRWMQMARAHGLDNGVLSRWAAGFGVRAATHKGVSERREGEARWARVRAALVAAERAEDISETVESVHPAVGEEIEQALRTIEPAFIPYQRSAYSLLTTRVEKLSATLGAPPVVRALADARRCLGVAEPIEITVDVVYREEPTGTPYDIPAFGNVVTWPVRTIAMSNYAAFEMLEQGLLLGPVAHARAPGGIPGAARTSDGRSILPRTLALGLAVSAWKPEDPLVFTRPKTCWRCDKDKLAKHALAVQQAAPFKQGCAKNNASPAVVQ
jgi:hypothetical protein